MNNTSVKYTSREIDFAIALPAEKKIFLDEILNDPIKTGFLMHFCELQYCTENIRFVVATYKYVDLFSEDKKYGYVWKSWESDNVTVPGTDTDVDSKPKENDLHSELVAAIDKDMEYIKCKYLTPDKSKYEICISEKMLASTLRRMKEYRIYGPEVFREACIDPMNTLIKDILPRFFLSDTYKDMIFYSGKINHLPGTSTLVIEPPSVESDYVTQFADCKSEDDAIAILQNVDNYFVKPLLYSQLLKYLKRVVATENLLCLRAIDIYCGLFDKVGDKHKSLVVAHAFDASPDTKVHETVRKVVEQSWLIYLYFLAPNSCYEVGVSHRTSRSVGRYMAVPRKEMFEPVKQDILSTFMHHFKSFLNDTAEFTELVAMVKQKYMDQLASKGKNIDSVACIMM